jgi:hypothetical protein
LKKAIEKKETQQAIATNKETVAKKESIALFLQSKR